jgi:hypothetical protein
MFKVEKIIISLILKGYNNVLEAKKTYFRLRDFKFLFLGELGTCPQNHIPTRHMEP